MSTPRTIKASEVRKGMRVEIEFPGDDFVAIARGVVLERTLTLDHGRVVIDFTGTAREYVMSPNHPVTVLADPEPEWVEGAWYWVELTSGPRRPLKRLAGGWTDHADDHAWFSDDDYPDIAVLGRVLIVDWPGDDVARELDAINDGNRSTSLSNYGRTTTHDTILRKVADAIRTQGGVR